jgi:hypothetical protein
VHQRNAIEDPKEDAFSVAMYQIGRYGSPEDVGHMVRFFATAEAGFVMGQAIAVDGGLTIQLHDDLCQLQSTVTTLCQQDARRRRPALMHRAVEALWPSLQPLCSLSLRRSLMRRGV